MDDKRIACVGGGQLAQMLAQAARPLGINVRSASAEGSCAFSDCEPFTKDLNDDNYLIEFLNDVDVFTFESEHEGLEFADRISSRGIPIYPTPLFVEIAGDRFLEKTHLSELNIPVAPFLKIDSNLSIEETTRFILETTNSKSLSEHGIVIKTRHGGYDGKGQWVISLNSEADFEKIGSEVFNVLKNPGCIVEGLVDFSLECSIVATRSKNGTLATWPLTHNTHENSILRRSLAPISGVNNLELIEKQAIEIVSELCEKNDYVGTIAVECFLTEDGLVVNEIAPRVHNSGHWTIEGSKTSQFEQHVRAITGMQLGPTDINGYCSMINLVGRSIDQESVKALDNVYLHWYGKEVKPDRKVGHITIVGKSETERDFLENEVLKILGEIEPS